MHMYLTFVDTLLHLGQIHLLDADWGLILQKYFLKCIILLLENFEPFLLHGYSIPS